MCKAAIAGHWTERVKRVKEAAGAQAEPGT